MSQRKTLGSLLVRLGMTDREADKAIKDFERKMRNLQRNLESIGRKMTLGLTVPIAGFAAASVKAASDAEETFAKFDVVFSKVAKDAERSFQTLRNQYGLSSKSAKQLLSDTGDLLTGFGFSQEAALDLSTQVNTLAVDLASFTNYSGGAQGASQALTKALLGERESVKALGIAILEEDVKKQMAIDSSKGMTFATERQAKAYATLQIALAQSKNAHGDYARTQGSFANQARSLKERVNDLAVSFGQVMLPAAEKLVKKLQSLVDWFQKLSPGAKEAVVQFAAFVAMAGPVLLLTNRIITLTKAVWGLVGAMKALGATKGGVVGAIAAAASAEVAAGGSGIEGGIQAGGQFAVWMGEKFSGKGAMPRSSKFGGTDLLLGVQPSNNPDSILNKLPAAVKDLTKSLDYAGDAANDYSSAIQRHMQWQTNALTPNRGNPAAGMSTILPNLAPALAGAVGNGGLTPLAGVGGHGPAIAGMMKIMPDMTAGLEAQTAALDNYKSTWATVAEAVGGALTGIAKDMEEGMSVFAAFGKAALLSAAQVAKAALVQVAANAMAAESKKGLPGILIGAAAGLAGISILEGLISNIKAPKLAKGGLAFGPTMAVVGDNPNAHVDPEVISPLSKLKGMMSQSMQQVQVAVTGQIAGDVIRLSAARSQNQAFRRGSPNTIRTSNLINY